MVGKLAHLEEETSNATKGRDGAPAGQAAPSEAFAKRTAVRYMLARLEGESSNTLFEILADWNAHLNHKSTGQSENAQDLATQRLKGPSP